MPSRKSRPGKTRPPSPSKAARVFSEAELPKLAAELARELKAGDRVLLEGPLGAGKTTFARELLRALGVEQPPEGSPTFAIAHEYRARGGAEVVHLDLYRIRHESELEDAGIHAYFWERPKAIVICEWLSMWPGFEAAVVESSLDRAGRCWRVELAFADVPERRGISLTLLK